MSNRGVPAEAAAAAVATATPPCVPLRTAPLYSSAPEVVVVLFLNSLPLDFASLEFLKASLEHAKIAPTHVF